MKHLGISGGGTKIAGLYGAAEVLLREKAYVPDVISGVSAGAILALPLALGKFDEIKELVLNLKLSTFFSERPINSNGSFRLAALWKIILGKPYLGKQENLEDVLRSFISKEEFEAYQNDSTKPACIIGTVDFITGGRIFFNLKEVSYDDFPVLVNASSSLPVFTKGITINMNNTPFYLYDGGVRDHIATAYILTDSKFKDQIDESISIFSRPKDFKVLPDEFDDRNVVSILSRYVDITNVEISKNDEYQIDEVCASKNIRNTKLYLPRVMQSTYDTDPARLHEIYIRGMEEARLNYSSVVMETA